MPEFELELDRVATGGAALGPGPDGRIVFVDGGLPGERVVASVVTEHATRVEARLGSLIRASSQRRMPPCPHVEDGCGGCDWQHASPPLQRQLRQAIVIDCLSRLGRFERPDVRLGPALEPTGYRTTVRVGVADGRAAYRAAGSHDLVVTDSCLVAHPLVEELLVDGRFGAASEVTIRAGAGTGERLVVASPTAEGVIVPPDVIVAGDDELAAGRAVHHHEEVSGTVLRISARSFFQCRPDGAAVLVDLARAALADASGPLIDAYCGVGLFGALLAADGDREVVGVESNRAAVADAEHNYRGRGSVIRAKMERWRPHRAAVVVADPARVGLGRAVVDRLVSTEAAVIALVSCDPASLARDAALLRDGGYHLDHVTVVDLFGNTSHVETVSRFTRAEPGS